MTTFHVQLGQVEGI